jgi:tRNA pseudouridine13 synthase
VIPQIDKDLGISYYSTKFNGCGGKIRVENEDFQVSEIISEKILSNVTLENGFAIYKLKKQNIDTSHALQQIFQKYGLRLKAVGLKDASAITEQFVCSQKKSNSTSNISDKKFSLKPVGFLKKPLSKKDMLGNHFKIKITDATSNLSNFNEFDKILNYFGYQRFGSKRPVTHLIGKSIIQKNFDGAIQILLSYTSKYDSKENTDIREKLSDKSNYSKIIQEIPPQMDLERIVLHEMIEHDDASKAIHALPINIRRFFVQAYQSFIFNRTISLAFNYGENLFLPQTGDVCFDKDGLLGKYSDDPSQRLAIPLVGYAYYKKTRFDKQISNVLDDEEISTKDFFLKQMQELSNEGGFRNASINIQDQNISENIASFTLSRGSYATIVLREIMKPENPIMAGF